MPTSSHHAAMLKLEDLTPGASVSGILPDSLVTVQWFGSDALELTYKNATGKVTNELLYRDAEARLELAARGRPWSFYGNGGLFRLVEDYILAIVEFLDENSHRVHSVRRPFQREPDFGVTSVNYNFSEILERAEKPR